MEEKAACSHHKVSEKCNLKHRVMFVLATAQKAFNSQVHEHQIGETIDDLRGIRRGIVVLFFDKFPLLVCAVLPSHMSSHTPQMIG